MESRLFTAIHAQLKAVMNAAGVDASEEAGGMSDIAVLLHKKDAIVPRLNNEVDSTCSTSLPELFESTIRILSHLDMVGEFRLWLEQAGDIVASLLVSAGFDAELDVYKLEKLNEREKVFILSVWLGLKQPSVVSNKFRFDHTLVVLLGCFDSNPMYRNVARRGLQVMYPQLDLHMCKEALVDAIIVKVADDNQWNDARMSYVVYELIQVGVDPTVLIDLVRAILVEFRPHNFPLWALEVMRVIAAQLKTHATGPLHETPNEQTMLAPAELIANEVIDRMKFCVLEPGELSDTTLVRAAYSLEIICACASVFMRRFPQAFIVRMCDIFNVLDQFLPRTCSVENSQENDLRLLFGLQAVQTLVDADDAAQDFFQARLDQGIWKLLLERNLTPPVKTEIQERLLQVIVSTLRNVLKAVVECKLAGVDTKDKLNRYYIAITPHTLDVD